MVTALAIFGRVGAFGDFHDTEVATSCFSIRERNGKNSGGLHGNSEKDVELHIVWRLGFWIRDDQYQQKLLLWGEISGE